MQDSREEQHDTHNHRRSQLPPLAPRGSHSTASRDHSSLTNAGPSRPPRLSHRSRAGCWTCRGRKVKCDEIHPRCGPCTRLNRECDWDHRWNFSDATSTTQSKYWNITTAGNVVWDPAARTSPNRASIGSEADDLPAFAVLTNDEDRERKAETRRPGTYGVVVVPESFADLPEYSAAASPASRRPSVQSSRSGFGCPTPSGPRRGSSLPDPNIVVLDRFEDANSNAAMLPSPINYAAGDRRYSFPDVPRPMSTSLSPTPPTPQLRQPYPPSLLLSGLTSDSALISHFRQQLVRLIIQPSTTYLSDDVVTPGSTRDIFEIEASRFPPLYQAICALSALNISCRSNTSLESAHQHYSQALISQSPAHPDELFSDGAFFRHFILFLYDICDPATAGSSEHNLWAQHLIHLKNIAIERRNRLGRDPHAFLIMCVMSLDTAACLMGNGSCEFVKAMVENGMVPPLDQQAAVVRPDLPTSFLPEEMPTFQDIIILNQEVLIHTAKLAQAAQAFRAEAASQQSRSRDVYARWQANVVQLQDDLHTSWALHYPKFLAADQPQASMVLPDRVRVYFEHAFLLFQAAVIYSRTSMFPNQRSLPVPRAQEIAEDTERRIATILALAIHSIENQHLDRHWLVFPVFVAGFATLYSDAKVQALELIRAMQGHGIGLNAARTRRLLKFVVEEQTRKVEAGGRMEEVDWLVIARERGLAVVNCGL